jgi:[methyl-Co(III) methanol-specific corrinoid protein]:coenzyme M methyltransferase
MYLVPHTPYPVLEFLMRDAILKLLSGEKISSIPAFSGLIHVIAEGLAREELRFKEIHTDARRMAKAATSTFKLTGMLSATLPLDLCAPAEMLGAQLRYYNEEEMQFPQVNQPMVGSVKEIGGLENWRLEIGRLPLICEAIGLVKNEIGGDAVISGMIPGPYTLLLYLCNPKNLFIEMKKEPQAVLDALFRLSSFLANIGRAYREAGADYIVIHDMGGSAGFIGPSKYEQFAFPAERDLIGRLPGPRVLSVCGDVTKSLELLNRTGAEAVSIDQTTDLTTARAALKDTLLFGNLDPVHTLWRGNKGQVAESVVRAKEAGVDAVWPGCDLALQSPLVNIKTMAGKP